MRIKSLILILSIILTVAGCSQTKEGLATGLTTTAANPESDDAQLPLAETEKEAVLSNLTSPDTLELCLGLLGKTDAEASEYFDSGEMNYTADRSYLIGRIYQVRIFDEEAVLYTSYDQDGRVDLIIIELKEQAQPPEYYSAAIAAFLEQPPLSDGSPGDDGSAVSVWEKEDQQIYLYNANGQITIQMLLPTKM